MDVHGWLFVFFAHHSSRLPEIPIILNGRLQFFAVLALTILSSMITHASGLVCTLLRVGDDRLLLIRIRYDRRVFLLQKGAAFVTPLLIGIIKPLARNRAVIVDFHGWRRALSRLIQLVQPIVDGGRERAKVVVETHAIVLVDNWLLHHGHHSV